MLAERTYCRFRGAIKIRAAGTKKYSELSQGQGDQTAPDVLHTCPSALKLLRKNYVIYLPRYPE